MAAATASPMLDRHDARPSPLNLAARNPTRRIDWPASSIHDRGSSNGPTQFRTFRLLRRPPALLLNPTNFTPRSRRRPRRPSSPPPPSVPLKHPALDPDKDVADPAKASAGDFPLLTFSEQRRSRHSPLAHLFEEGRGSTDRRASLPRSVRSSYEGGRSRNQTPTPLRPDFPAVQEGDVVDSSHSETATVRKATTMAPQTTTENAPQSFNHDLEHGLDGTDGRDSIDGIGSALSSSNSSIMGEQVEPDVGDEWGPLHACFPHLNPHVPVDSIEYVTTRIIRVRRDWLLQGDLAPTFSNLYPEILDPAGIPETEFRRIIDKLNAELVPAFNAYSARNVLDGVLGVVTGWLWDDLGLTGVKSRLNRLEQWIDNWNRETEKTFASEEGALPPKIISLRRTGYMTLDIQIPDPEIAPAPSSRGFTGSVGGTHTEPMSAITA